MRRSWWISWLRVINRVPNSSSCSSTILKTQYPLRVDFLCIWRMVSLKFRRHVSFISSKYPLAEEVVSGLLWAVGLEQVLLGRSV